MADIPSPITFHDGDRAIAPRNRTASDHELRSELDRMQALHQLAAGASPLPAGIQEALGELVGAAREGLLALSVGVGLRVVHDLMEAEVTEIVGPKGKHDLDRAAKRHGHEDGSMTFGGGRVLVSRPRIRTADDERELPVASYE